ncbi:MAG: bifunctional DNA primase/polymerase [Formivibrio sp.]|nr:bifunctional DNA primase/polymerase [Formivibrio sp.]
MIASPSVQDEVLALRGILWKNGVRPVSVYSPGAVEWTGQAITNAGKRPNCKNWHESALASVPDACTAKPTTDALNTGILCDSLIALDLDIDDSTISKRAISAAIHFLGNAPMRVRSDSARVLMLYRAAEGEPSKRSINGTGGKVEALGSGQQFVAFGQHPNGATYTWPQGSPAEFSRDMLPPVTADALQAFLCAVAPLVGADAPAPYMATGRDHDYANSVLSDECAKLAAMVEGTGRNNQLNISAHSVGTLVGNGSIDAETVSLALLDAAAKNGHVAKHGISQTQATIESGLNAGMKKPRKLKSSEVPSIDISGLLQNAKAITAKEWPAPLNGDAYIGIAGDFIRLVAPQTEGDPAALLLAFLTLVGSLVGRGAYLPVGPTHHYGNLFSVIIAETSKGRKGTVMAEAKRFATMIDPTMSARMLGGLSSGEGLIEAVRDARFDDAQNEQGKLPIAKVIDNGIVDKRLLVTESEMGQALQAAGREGNTLSAVLRMSWDGDELRTLARSNKNVCREPHISIFGNITLDELQRLLTSTDRTNGFGNRFLWVCAKRSQELPWGGNVDEAALRSLAAKAAHVINIATYYGQCGWMPDAASMWAREYSRLSAGRPGLAGAMSARAEAQTLRIALLYAILDGCNNVDIPHLKAALEVWRYCQDSVDYCFGGTADNSSANRIYSYLVTMPKGASLTQVSSYFGRNKKSDELQRALTALKESGIARSETRKTGGRAADIWFAC